MTSEQTARYDVFISHRSVYKPWVEILARNLKVRGYEVFLDLWELLRQRIGSAASWRNRISVRRKSGQVTTCCGGCIGRTFWRCRKNATSGVVTYCRR